VKTSFLLVSQYDGMTIVPVEWVCRDFFRHLSVEKFLRKTLTGEIAIPVVRMDSSSQKTAKGIHVNDLSEYLDKQAEAARKECRQLAGGASTPADCASPTGAGTRVSRHRFRS
jgi:hypothetical protein